MAESSTGRTADTFAEYFCCDNNLDSVKHSVLHYARGNPAYDFVTRSI